MGGGFRDDLFSCVLLSLLQLDLRIVALSIELINLLISEEKSLQFLLERDLWPNRFTVSAFLFLFLAPVLSSTMLVGIVDDISLLFS